MASQQAEAETADPAVIPVSRAAGISLPLSVSQQREVVDREEMTSEMERDGWNTQPRCRQPATVVCRR
jgi:hypothetical protein